MAGKLSGSAIQTGTITSTQLSTELGPVSSELQLVGSGVSLNVSNNAVFSGSVGIGTTNPTDELTINSNGLSTGIALQRSGTQIASLEIGSSSNNFAIRSDTATGFLTFTAGASERMRITDAGNVGIGTTSPSQKLHVVGKLLVTDDVQLTGSNPRIDFNSNGASALRFYDTTAAAERARFDISGNLCVGSSSPGNAGSLNISIGNPGTTVGGLQLWSTTSGTHYVQFGDSASGGDPYRGALGYVHASDAMTFWTAGGERARITDTGNVGIGTTNPLQKLHVFLDNGEYAHFGSLLVNANTEYSGISLGYREAAGYSKTAIVQEQIGDGAARGHLHFLVDINADGNNVVLGDSKMMIHGISGNVGIGTTSPAGTLDVNGILYVSGYSAIQALSSTAGYVYRVIGGNGSGNGAVSYFDIRQPAPRDFRNGTLAFGFTSYGLDNSGAWADAFAMCSYTDSTGGNPNIMVVGRNGSGVKVARQTWDSADYFKDGTVYTLDYTSASDVSVKEDVQNITNALSIITQLRPVTFKWTDDYILNGMSKNNNENVVDPDTGIIIIPEEKTLNVGLIAQEVEAVLPTVVHQENVKLKDADRYLKNINYEKLVPHLIAAIQELKAEIDALKAQG